MHGCSLETKRGLLNESQRCIVRQWQRRLAGPVFVILRRAVRSAEIRSSGKRSYPDPRSAGARISSSGKIFGGRGDPRAGRVAGLRSGGRLVRPSVGAKADSNSELVFKKYRSEIPTLAKSARVEHPRCGYLQKSQSSRPDHARNLLPGSEVQDTTGSAQLRRNSLGLPELIFHGITHIAPATNVVFTFPIIAMKAGPGEAYLVLPDDHRLPLHRQHGCGVLALYALERWILFFRDARPRKPDGIYCDLELSHLRHPRSSRL
jgi:hypothetical protein